MYVTIVIEQSSVGTLLEIVDDRVDEVRRGNVVVDDRAEHVRELRAIGTALRTAEGAFATG